MPGGKGYSERKTVAVEGKTVASKKGKCKKGTTAGARASPRFGLFSWAKCGVLEMFLCLTV